jgi:hypothetical protein
MKVVRLAYASNNKIVAVIVLPNHELGMPEGLAQLPQLEHDF